MKWTAQVSAFALAMFLAAPDSFPAAPPGVSRRSGNR
jgi:hypothetical protein